MRTLLSLAALGLLTVSAIAQDAGGAPTKPADPPKPADTKTDAKPADTKGDAKPAAGAAGKAVTAADAKSVLDFTVNSIDGKETPLSKYKGKVLLIVNVASKCGYTPQYEGLEALYDENAGKGFAILAFPANNFNGQEPGANEDIKSFCTRTYAVTFDLFSKVSVKGADCCELYKYLTSKESNPQFGGDIKWNFTKFLVDRDGKIVARFEPKDTPQLIKPQVLKLLEAKPADAKPTDAKPAEKPAEKKDRK